VVPKARGTKPGFKSYLVTIGASPSFAPIFLLPGIRVDSAGLLFV